MENLNGKTHFYTFQNDHPLQRHLCSGSLQVPIRHLTLVKCLSPSQQAPIYAGFYRAEIRGGGPISLFEAVAKNVDSTRNIVSNLH